MEISLCKVRIIRVVDLSALVEWRAESGRLSRGYVPVAEIEGEGVTPEVLELAIPHGLDWEDRLDLSHVTAEALADELRVAGIWTLEDLRVRDRALVRIGTNLIGKAVWKAAQQLEEST